MTAEAIAPSGDIPKPRRLAGSAVVGHRLFVLGGYNEETKAYVALDTVDILDLCTAPSCAVRCACSRMLLATCTWATKPVRGEAPGPCEGLNVVAQGKYLLKYGGHTDQGCASSLAAHAHVHARTLTPL